MWAYHSTRDGNGGADTGDSLSFAQHTSKGSFVANILATLKDGVIDAKNQGGGDDDDDGEDDDTEDDDEEEDDDGGKKNKKGKKGGKKGKKGGKKNKKNEDD